MHYEIAFLDNLLYLLDETPTKEGKEKNSLFLAICVTLFSLVKIWKTN